MAFLKYLLGASGAEAPMQAPDSADNDDEVYPVHTFDDPGRMEILVTTWTMRFNDVLDRDKIHKSLAKLLEIGDWRKAGGRLRQKVKGQGQLEIYAPRNFTAERPAVTFTSQTYNMAIEDHPLAARLPTTSEKPQLHPAPVEFREFAVPPGAPETLEHYLAGDIPMISLRITSFHNGTLIGLSWPHTLMDVMGQQALLRAWSLVLAGKMSEVPPMLGARKDAMIEAANVPQETAEEYILKPQIMKRWALVKVLINFVWDLFWYRTVETRTIFLPKQALANLRLQAQMDIATEKQELPFISEGDVLTAWTIRAVASALPQPRSITAVHAVNTRLRVRSLIDAPGLFVQNMCVAAFTFVEHSIAIGPLGPIALLNRKYMLEQATEAQVLANLRELQKQPPGRMDPVSMMCGDPDALLMPYTNWDRADLIHAVDFSAAVLKQGESGPLRINPPGTIVYHHAAAMVENPPARNFTMVLGKDHGGNQWITGSFLPPAWAKIVESMKDM